MTGTKEQRMIVAGKLIIGEGLSLKQALIKAGYSEQTARCPKANGISAELCVSAAIKQDRGAIPATIRASARKLLLDAIQSADPKKTSLAAIARTAETVERWYGHTGDSDSLPPRPFLKRLKWVMELDRLIKEEAAAQGIIDVEPLAPARLSEAQEDNSDPDGPTVPGEEKGRLGGTQRHGGGESGGNDE